ncbi:ErfK/YbiS/YcfS/YnhG family protein (fragment) [Candidatus Filomicrobium marinum]|uniref:ErfK/YbiS/YcfS/YnhG family protein n=2 Tax=Filomicrobium TaxID=119044 RepID=A0A0D6JFS5_9HYPH
MKCFTKGGRALVSAALSLTMVALASSAANAQDLFSFLWSGGYRDTVSFSPKYSPGQIIVSFGDRKLYWIHRRGEAISYPIAVPREQSRWSGVTSVSQKRVNPGWTPTPQMRRENPKLPVHVPGGHPLNPLGVRALYLGSSLYRIHGTDAPWTIGTAVSKGCIRMYNEDVLDLYPRVPVGTRVTVTWKRFTT